MKRLQLILGITIYLFFALFGVQEKWIKAGKDAEIFKINNTDTLIILKARDLIAVRWGWYHGLGRSWNERVIEFRKCLHFNHYIESPLVNTKFFVFSEKGIDPSSHWLMCSYDNMVMEVPPVTRGYRAPRFDDRTDLLLNNRLLVEPRFDANKFIEFVRFYNRLFEYDWEIRKVLTSWKEIEFSRHDNISDELKNLIKPLSVSTSGGEIKVKIYVWQLFSRDLREMNFVYNNGQFWYDSKLLGIFGDIRFVL